MWIVNILVWDWYNYVPWQKSRVLTFVNMNLPYVYEHDTRESLKTFFKSDSNDVICHYIHELYVTDWRKTIPCLNWFWGCKIFLSIIVSFVPPPRETYLLCLSSHPTFHLLEDLMHSAWGRCIAIILQASYPCDSDDTKWHRRLILSISLDGDCIPLSPSTRITTAEANGNESTIFPVDRFFYTKVPRLYSKMDIQIYNIRNRDVKDDNACSLFVVTDRALHISIDPGHPKL
jgi:hypothetical protein